MRYICLKTIVTKVFDGILENDDEILSVLSAIQNKEITCSLQEKQGPLNVSVRILDINETEIIWRVLKDGTSLKKKTKISDIIMISVNVDDELIINKPNSSRWSSLDASDI